MSVQTSEPIAVSAVLAGKASRNAEHLHMLRVRVDHACTAMADTFGEHDHRVQAMYRRLQEILHPENAPDENPAAISLAAAYCAWCMLYPDEIVRIPTRPCRCDGGWTEEEAEEGSSMTVRPCSRCNGDVYEKFFENRRAVEERVYGAAATQAQERKPPFDPDEDW